MNWQVFYDKLQARYGFEYFGIYYGEYRALVMRNDDPEERGRIQIKCPRAGHKRVLDHWVDPSFAVAGDDFGVFAPPEVGSTVRVTFDRGDPSKPYAYKGGWHGEAQLPAEFGYVDGKPTKRGFVSRAGHTVVINDEKDNESIRIIWHKPDADDEFHDDPKKAADRTQGEFALLSFEPDGSIQVANSEGSRIDLNATDGFAAITHQDGHQVGLDEDGVKVVDSGGNLIAVVNGEIQAVANQTIHLVAPNVNVKAGGVFLGDGASQSVVLGEAFQLLFNTHTHPTPSGPSGPPTPPMTPNELSRSVKAKG